MSLFKRALLRELSRNAAGVFVALFAILLTVVLIRLLGRAAGGQVPPQAVLSLIGLSALAQLPLITTLSVFLAVLIVISRICRDSEMAVWIAAGVPLARFVWPVLQFAWPFVLLVGFGSLLIGPWANLQSAHYLAQLQSESDTSTVAPGVFRESARAGRVLFVEDAALADGVLRNVFLSAVSDSHIDIVVAKTGSVGTDEDGSRYALLENGRRFEGEAGSAELRMMSFAQYKVWLTRSAAVAPNLKLKTISTQELIQMPLARNLGELSSRIGAPLACLLLVLLAIPMAWVNPRTGRGGGFLVAIMVYLLYANSISLLQVWVGREQIGFVTALLLPHLLAAAVLWLWLYRRTVLVPWWRK